MNFKMRCFLDDCDNNIEKFSKNDDEEDCVMYHMKQITDHCKGVLSHYKAMKTKMQTYALFERKLKRLTEKYEGLKAVKQKSSECNTDSPKIHRKDPPLSTHKSFENHKQIFVQPSPQKKQLSELKQTITKINKENSPRKFVLKRSPILFPNFAGKFPSSSPRRIVKQQKLNFSGISRDALTKEKQNQIQKPESSTAFHESDVVIPATDPDETYCEELERIKKKRNDLQRKLNATDQKESKVKQNPLGLQRKNTFSVEKLFAFETSSQNPPKNKEKLPELVMKMPENLDETLDKLNVAIKQEKPSPNQSGELFHLESEEGHMDYTGSDASSVICLGEDEDRHRVISINNLTLERNESLVRSLEEHFKNQPEYCDPYPMAQIPKIRSRYKDDNECRDCASYYDKVAKRYGSTESDKRRRNCELNCKRTCPTAAPPRRPGDETPEGFWNLDFTPSLAIDTDLTLDGL